MKRFGRRSRALLVPAVLAVALALTGCELQPNDNTLPGQVAVGDDGYTVKVHFDQIENLVPNSTVQKDNVVIGTVGKITTDGWEAVVTMHLLKDVELPADAVFSIGQKTLLGAQYVEVADPAAGTVGDNARTLADGAVIGVEQTGTYPATEQVLGAVALLLNNGGLAQISTITGELSTALRQRVPDTRSLIDRSNELLTVLDDNRGEIVAALESLDDLSAGLAEDKNKIASAIDRITPGLATLEKERVRLVDAITETAATGDTAVRVVEASETALLANLDSLVPILRNLGKASTSVPEALKIGLTIPFPAMTTQDALRGDYANLFATIDLRGTSLLDSWLGGNPIAQQAGDPVEDPLKVGEDSTDDDTETTDQPGDDTDQGKGPKDTDDSDRSDDTDTTPQCLLALLGLC